MKEILNKLVDDLLKKIGEEKYEKKLISDFEFEIRDDSECYSIKYNSEVVCLEKEDHKISEWRLNQNSINKDLDDIVNDFANTISPKKIENKFIQDRPKRIDQKEVDFDKMASRVLQFFPNERETFDKNSSLREKIRFLKDKILPQINKMISRTKDDKKIERMFNNLCNDYAFGDEQARCVITMLIFNGVTDKECRAKIKSILPNYMKKTWDASWRVGKKNSIQ